MLELSKVGSDHLPEIPKQKHYYRQAWRTAVVRQDVISAEKVLPF